MNVFTVTYTDVYDRLSYISRNMANSPEGSDDYARYGIEYDDILFDYISYRDYTELVKRSSNVTDWIAFDANIIYGKINNRR